MIFFFIIIWIHVHFLPTGLLEDLEDQTSLDASNERDSSNPKSKPKLRRPRRQIQLHPCENDLDCHRGQFCDTETKECLDNGQQEKRSRILTKKRSKSKISFDSSNDIP